MRIWWRQTTWVVLVPLTTHIPSLTKIGHCVLIRERRFTLWYWQESYISTYICTYHAYKQRDKWKRSGPSSIAGSPQQKSKQKLGTLLTVSFYCFRSVTEGNTSCFLGLTQHQLRNVSYQSQDDIQRHIHVSFFMPSMQVRIPGEGALNFFFCWWVCHTGFQK